MVWDGGKWLEVYLGCSYNDFITICFIIGGNYYWKHTIKEGIYKACKDGAAAFVHGVSDAFTLSICFEALERFSAFLNRKNFNAIQLSIISVVFCHREPLFFMPKNFKNITKNS